MILDDVYDVVLSTWPTEAGGWLQQAAKRNGGTWKEVLDLARSHEFGDTLLDFVLKELHDRVPGETSPGRACHEVLTRAIEDLNLVHAALREEEIIKDDDCD